MTPALLGAALGLAAALGLLLAVLSSPPLRRTTLDDRLVPYLRDTPRPSRLLARAEALTPFPTLERLLGPALVRLADRVETVVGGGVAVTRRLDALGDGQTLAQFRAEQVLCAGAGLAVVLGGFVVSVAAGSPWSPVLVVALAVVAVVGGVYAREQWLARRLAAREAAVLAELPTVAELLALAVAAGEGVGGAIERVVRTSDGELARDLRRVVAEVRTGAPLPTELSALAARTRVVPLSRFLEGVVVAVERGTPLADVLRAQAADVREAGRRELLEAAGRKEVAMLAPVVFLVLPVTVLFALFPAAVTLTSVAR